MKNHQIERSTKTKSRAVQQRREIRRRQLAFIEAHGDKDTLRKLDLFIDSIVALGKVKLIGF